MEKNMRSVRNISYYESNSEARRVNALAEIRAYGNAGDVALVVMPRKFQGYAECFVLKC